MEVEEHDDHVIFLRRKFRPLRCLSFEVHRLDSEVREVPLFRRGSKLHHGLFIAIYRINMKTVRGEIERVTPRPSPKNQHAAIVKPDERVWQEQHWGSVWTQWDVNHAAAVEL